MEGVVVIFSKASDDHATNILSCEPNKYPHFTFSFRDCAEDLSFAVLSSPSLQNCPALSTALCVHLKSPMGCTGVSYIVEYKNIGWSRSSLVYTLLIVIKASLGPAVASF